MKDRDLVILSVYDGGYCGSLLEGDKITDLDEWGAQDAFKSRFGEFPGQITLKELRKHYPEGTTVIICSDGVIYK